MRRGRLAARGAARCAARCLTAGAVCGLALLAGPSTAAAGHGSVSAALSLSSDGSVIEMSGEGRDFARTAQLQVRLILLPADGGEPAFDETRPEPCYNSTACGHSGRLSARPGSYRLRVIVYEGRSGDLHFAHDDYSQRLDVPSPEAAAEPSPSPDEETAAPAPSDDGAAPAEDTAPDDQPGQGIQGAASACRGDQPPSFRFTPPPSCVQDVSNLRQSARARVALVAGETRVRDSHDRVVLVIVRSRRGTYAVRLPGGATLRPANKPVLVGFGRGCPNRRDRLLVSYDGGAGQRFRGFVLPRSIVSRSDRAAMVAKTAGCGRQQGREEGRFIIKDPAFGEQDAYERTDGRDDGNHYASYNARANGSLYLSTSTTAVRGGGVPRAIVFTGDTFVRYGHTESCDANTRSGGCVTWSFGFVAVDGGRQAWGWVPTRALEGPS